MAHESENSPEHLYSRVRPEIASVTPKTVVSGDQKSPSSAIQRLGFHAVRLFQPNPTEGF